MSRLLQTSPETQESDLFEGWLRCSLWFVKYICIKWLDLHSDQKSVFFLLKKGPDLEWMGLRARR